MAKWIDSLSRPQRRAARALLTGLRDAISFLLAPDTPAGASLHLETEGMPSTFSVLVSKDGNESNDIVSGELSVTVNVNDVPTNQVKQFPFVSGPDPIVVGPFDGDQNAIVHVEGVWIDDATPPNRSVTPLVFDGPLLDTIPPSNMAGFGLKMETEG